MLASTILQPQKNVAFVYAFKSFRRFEISEFQALNQHISTLKSARNQLPTGSSSLSELNSTRQGRCSSAWKLERSVHGALELLGALEAELSEVIGKTYSKNGSNDSNWFKLIQIDSKLNHSWLSLFKQK